VTGAAGGPTIITATMEVILNVIEHHMSLADAMRAPRLHHQALPDTIRYERNGLSGAVVDSLTVDAPKTKLLAQKLKGMGLNNVLIITDTQDDNLRLSSRNLHYVSVASVSEADPVSLIRHDKVVVTRNAVTKIEEMLA